jgi:ACS family hexuronate transporter-like MFS transporter
VSPTAKPPIRHLRWLIVILLCLASLVNYLDRQTFSVLANTLEKAFNLRKIDYSFLTAIFLWTYAVAYFFSGYIVDRLGTRRSYLVFASGWSIANAFHALANGFTGLAVSRGFLAVMEPANFPAGLKAVSEWFPLRERALAVGIFNSGTALGNALAVPVAAFFTLHYGWRSAFLFTGGLGLLWVAVWAAIYRRPQEHPRLGKEERELIEAGQRQEDGAGSGKVPMLEILRMREAWGCMLARLLTDPISYFLYFWTPKYLENERGFDLQHIGMLAWIPFAVLVVGNLFSGAMPRWLISRGWTLNRARKTTMLWVSCGMVVVCYLVTKAPTPATAVGLLALVMFGHASWGNMTLPAEVFPKNVVGTVTGLGGFLGGISGGVAQLIIGGVVIKYGYGPIFALCSVMYLVALAVVHCLIGELGVIRKVPQG